jgi:hypothetical protein
MNELMEANELKGASKKRLIKFLGNKYDPLLVSASSDPGAYC